MTEDKNLEFTINTLKWANKVAEEEPGRKVTPEEYKDIRAALLMAMTYDPLLIAELLKGDEA